MSGELEQKQLTAYYRREIVMQCFMATPKEMHIWMSLEHIFADNLSSQDLRKILIDRDLRKEVSELDKRIPPVQIKGMIDNKIIFRSLGFRYEHVLLLHKKLHIDNKQVVLYYYS